jgi:tRNA (guanine-N7-)-methyltransferase
VQINATPHSSDLPINYALGSILETIELATLFEKIQPLEVELGSGDGSFLIEHASTHPEHNFIGIERLLGRLRKIEKKARQSKLRNLRAIRIESAYFLRYLLPRHCVSALHIYFPDPWPKRKHQRHRLINESFPALAQQVLVPQGRVYLRTDDRDYFAQMERVFAASPFRRVETQSELAAVRTDFEAAFNKRGILTLRAAYESPAHITTTHR